MRAVIQRVKNCILSIDDQVYSQINQGLLLFLGIVEEDKAEDIEWVVSKTLNLRIFSDQDEKMNLSLLDTNGQIMVVSQFTLMANCKKGNRPSFIRAAHPEIAIPLYESCLEMFNNNIGKNQVESGVFGADMQIQLHNDGPVTILLDSKNKEL